MMIEEGQKIPDISLSRDGGDEVALSDFEGQNLILYFYPKDNTPGCTTEAIDFTGLLDDFEKLDTIIVGVSPDSVKKHENFIDKHNLEIILLADTEKELLEKLGLWVEKKMYGRTYMGVERTTLAIDKQGTVQKIWKKVKVKGHAQEVLEFVQDTMQ